MSDTSKKKWLVREAPAFDGMISRMFYDEDAINYLMRHTHLKRREIKDTLYKGLSISTTFGAWKLGD